MVIVPSEHSYGYNPLLLSLIKTTYSSKIRLSAPLDVVSRQGMARDGFFRQDDFGWFCRVTVNCRLPKSSEWEKNFVNMATGSVKRSNVMSATSGVGFSMMSVSSLGHSSSVVFSCGGGGVVSSAGAKVHLSEMTVYVTNFSLIVTFSCVERYTVNGLTDWP